MTLEAVVEQAFQGTMTLCLIAMCVAAAMCLYRIITGPNVADRAIGLDTLLTVFIGIICIMCMKWQSLLYFEAVWIMTLVGFLGSASIARYMEKGRVF